MIGLGDQSLGLGDHQLLGRKGTCCCQSLTDGLDQGAEQGLAASNRSAPGSLQPPSSSLVLPTWPREFGGLGSVSHLLTYTALCGRWTSVCPRLQPTRRPGHLQHQLRACHCPPSRRVSLPRVPSVLLQHLPAEEGSSSRCLFGCLSTRWPLSSSSFGGGTFSPGHSLRGGVMTGK